jgi:asparagine synthase (glutamine-hydrolysing)
MSGIVGIINLDGRQIDRQLLQRMTEFMDYRGPDVRQIWTDGPVGFGHTMLRTTFESEFEQQPCSLDGQVWITADARIDGRKELVSELERKGRHNLRSATDPELILHAYHVWGEGCVDHLLGDFVFALWDSPRRRLFCGRDHFGVKPFYYARTHHRLVFSNTLNCVRTHPAVSDDLNDSAIADFLLFGANQELSTTTFADIQRLPPAHLLTWSMGATRISRYWTLPTDGEIRYRRASDYVEHFKEHLRAAVSDRLRTNRVGITMSGGLDSTSIAVIARELLSERAEPYDLRAYTTVYDRLIPDQERHYSGLAAEALNIPIHYLVADDYSLFDGWEQAALQRHEPIDNPLEAVQVDQYRQIAANSRVVLGGSGGDALLAMSRSYFVELLKSFRIGRLIREAAGYAWSYGKRPPLNFRSTFKSWLGISPAPWRMPFPVWLDESFMKRIDLQARWDQINNVASSQQHATHAAAYENILLPLWPNCFESWDPGGSLFPVESRQPFFDVRLVNYVLAIPLVPWSIDKTLLRTLVRGILPDAVRLRPKTILAGDPVLELLRHSNLHWMDQFDPALEFASYVNRSKVEQLPAVQERPDIYECYLNLRPCTLNLWLKQPRPNQMKPNTHWERKLNDGYTERREDKDSKTIPYA